MKSTASEPGLRILPKVKDLACNIAKILKVPAKNLKVQ